ncbi:unnamed protein product [Sympodiomycopsis kandeliae]
MATCIRGIIAQNSTWCICGHHKTCLLSGDNGYALSIGEQRDELEQDEAQWKGDHPQRTLCSFKGKATEGTEKHSIYA